MADLDWLTARPIAHRGYHDSNRSVWENTLSAFTRAADRGFAIECDVHLTLDDEVIVIHDDALERLTGTDGYVWQRTAAELRSLSIGGTQDHPPLLTEMLDLIAGRVPIIVELKGTPGRDHGLVRRVSQILAGYPGKVAIMSFDHWLVRDFAKCMPNIPGGLTAWGKTGREVEAHFAMLAHGIAFTSYAIDHLPNPFISFVRGKLGMPVICWTVRDQTAVQKTWAEADQMTFEGFDPENGMVA